LRIVGLCWCGIGVVRLRGGTAVALGELHSFGQLVTGGGGGGAICGHAFEGQVRNAATKSDDDSKKQNFTDNQPHGIPSPNAVNFPAPPNRRRICVGASRTNSEFPLYRKDKFLGLEEKKNGSSQIDTQKWRNFLGKIRTFRGFAYFEGFGEPWVYVVFLVAWLEWEVWVVVLPFAGDTLLR
jgi:hypothetical protein